MVKKLVAKREKRRKASSRLKAKPKTKVTSPVGTMKGGIMVGGSIKAGRDVVTGDQYNYNWSPISNVSSATEFIVELQRLQIQITELKQQSVLTPAQAQTIEVVEGQVKEVVAEVQKPQPLGARITATLADAQAVMASLAGSVASAVGLGTALAGLGQIALKLFGG